MDKNGDGFIDLKEYIGKDTAVLFLMVAVYLTTEIIQSSLGFGLDRAIICLISSALTCGGVAVTGLHIHWFLLID